MPTGAAENDVWAAACDKFGIEAESIVYAGRSCFIDPTGAVVAEFGPAEDAALVHEPIADVAPWIERDGARCRQRGVIGHTRPNNQRSATGGQRPSGQ